MAISTAGALGAGALAGGGSAWGGITSAQSSRAAARDAAQMQMDWELLRGTHAHQWEVADLKAAGLNPVLSAGGSGAVTGGISAPVPDTSGYAQAGGALGNMLTYAMELQKNGAEVANLQGNTANLNADTKVKQEQAKLVLEQTLSEMVKRGMMSAQKAGIEFDNLKKQFDIEHQNMTYWNEFFNKASGTAANVATAGDKILGVITNKLLPKADKGGKFKHERTEFGKNWRETFTEYN